MPGRRRSTFRIAEAMFLDEYTDHELTKRAELARMKQLAAALLALACLIYVASSLFEAQYVWAGFIAAAAEAAMVGAVAALFRHPLGIPIPHTAIIPRRKDVIADQFGAFVQQNFLSEEVISDKVKSMDLSRSVAAWLVRSDNARNVAEQVTTGLAGMVRVMNDKDIQKLIESRVEARIRDTSFAPIIGELLTFITSGRRQQELFDGAVALGLRLLDDSDNDIRSTVSAETPWWFPSAIDRAIYEKIVRSVSRMLYEMQVDIYHPLRVRMVSAMNSFMDDLKHSDDIASKEAAIKEDLLQEPAIRDFTSSLWNDIKAELVAQSEHPDGDLKGAIEDSVRRFSNTILEDEKLAEKIDTWAEESARYLIRTFGHEVADLIANTIEKWNPEATSERIEIQIGRDLQFIRINGTVVGGLVGLVIHSITYMVPVLN